MNYQFKSIEEYDQAINNAEKEFKEVEHERYQNREEQEEATKELKRQLEEINKPFDAKDDSLEEKSENIQHQKWELESEKRKFGFHLASKHAFEVGYFDVESAKAYLQEHNLSSEPIALKKDLTDIGVKIFRVVEKFGATKLYAFQGLKLVGFWRKRQGAHRGDDTFGEAYVGFANLKAGKELGRFFNKNGVPEESHPFYRKPNYFRRIDPTMEHFVDYLIHNPDKLVEINLTKENIDFLRKDEN